jgi:branched-chain amino acid transport system substrate-binding protein
VTSDEYDFATLDNIMIFDAEDITTPIGQESLEWIGTLGPELIDNVDVDTYAAE